jgi:hypothetical protein
MRPVDALDVIFSLMVDEIPVGPESPRWKIREKVNEVLNRPFDPDEAREYDLQLWAKQNDAAFAEGGWDGQIRGDDDSGFAAAPSTSDSGGWSPRP